MREKNQETQADIIAEMRMGNPVGPCVYRIGLPDKEEVYESGAKRRITMIKDVTVQELADRLEAATKREKAQPGNAAAMREALVKSLDALKSLSRAHNDDLPEDVRAILGRMAFEANAALSAPARNQKSLESPMDLNEQIIHIGDAVHMLTTRHDGDHEWDDVVMSLEYVGKSGGDSWLVHGEDGAAWACECEVLKREGGGDGSK